MEWLEIPPEELASYADHLPITFYKEGNLVAGDMLDNYYKRWVNPMFVRERAIPPYSPAKFCINYSVSKLAVAGFLRTFYVANEKKEVISFPLYPIQIYGQKRYIIYFPQAKWTKRINSQGKLLVINDSYIPLKPNTIIPIVVYPLDVIFKKNPLIGKTIDYNRLDLNVGFPDSEYSANRLALKEEITYFPYTEVSEAERSLVANWDDTELKQAINFHSCIKPGRTLSISIMQAKNKPYKLVYGLGIEREQAIFGQEVLLSGREIKLNSKSYAEIYGRYLVDDFLYPVPSRIQVDPLTRIELRLAMDSTSLGDIPEFISSDPYYSTIGKVVSQIQKQKDKLMTRLPKGVKYPENGRVPFVRLNGDGIIASGTGSFHFNITLPYQEGYVQCKYQHMYAMMVLQWLEPLLVGTFGSPDPFCMVDKKLSRGSQRLLTSITTGYGSAFLNLPQESNKLGPTYRLLNARFGTVRMESIKMESSLAAKEISGMDFRWDPAKERLGEYLYFGFEFRILDAMPLDLAEQVLRLLILCCDHSYTLMTNKVKLAPAITSGLWQNISRRIFEQGHNTLLTPFECKELLNQIHFKTMEPINSNIYVGQFLIKLANNLYKVNYEKGPYSQHLSLDSANVPYTGSPKLYSYNAFTKFNLINIFFIDPKTKRYRGDLLLFYNSIPRNMPIMIDINASFLPPSLRGDTRLYDFYNYLVFYNQIQVINKNSSDVITQVIMT